MTYRHAPTFPSITLPPLPFDLPPSARDETAPRGPMITCAVDWRKDPVLRGASYYGGGKSGLVKPQELRDTLAWVTT